MDLPLPRGFIQFTDILENFYGDANNPWKVKLPISRKKVMAPSEEGKEVDCELMARRFEPFLSDKLINGDLLAVGLGLDDGQLMLAPLATWRRYASYYDDDGKSRTAPAVLAALLGGDVRFPYWNGFNYAESYICVPLVEAHALAVAFGAAKPPPSAPRTVVRVLDKSQHAPKPSIATQTPTRLPSVANPKKAKGGAPVKHNWDAFWIEVVLWAAVNDLLPDEQGRTELQSHMVEWCHQRFGDTAPDPRTIRDKLRELYVACKRRMEPG